MARSIGRSSFAGRDRAVVADHPARDGGEDWREGHRSRPLHGIPDGRGGGAARPIQAHPGDDRRTATKADSAMLRLAGRITKGSTDRPSAPAVLLNSPRSGQTELTNHRSGGVDAGEPGAVLRRARESSYLAL